MLEFRQLVKLNDLVLVQFHLAVFQLRVAKSAPSRTPKFVVEVARSLEYLYLMSQALEKRVEELEKTVAELTGKAGVPTRAKNPWRTFGVFKDDPIFEEAVRLGREYREQQACDNGPAGS